MDGSADKVDIRDIWLGPAETQKKHPTNSVLSVFFLSLWKLSLLLLTPVNLQVQISVGIALQ